MLTFSLLCEDVVLRKDVGGGLGGFIGRGLGAGIGAGTGFLVGGPIGAGIGISGGSILGGQLGRLIGKNTIDDPEGAADFSKASHRIGYMAKPLTGGWGAAGDVIAPGLTSSVNSIYQGVSDDGAKRLGYRLPGRLGTALFGPLAGLASPDDIAKNK